MCTLSANPTDKGNPKEKKSFVVTAIWWSLEKNKSLKRSEQEEEEREMGFWSLI